MAAPRRQATGGAQATRVTVTLGARQGQHHCRAQLPAHRHPTLLHVVLCQLPVGRDLDARALQGRASIGPQARRQVVAGNSGVFQQPVGCLVAGGHRDDRTGCQAMELGRQARIPYTERQGHAGIRGIAENI